MLNVKWKEENYLFAINGQTGRIVGKPPISYLKVAAMYLKQVVQHGAILYLILLAMNLLMGGLS